MASGGSRIKGITVEIGGDVTGLEQALRTVNNRSKNLQSELKDVQRALKFDPNNVELLAQRQQILTEQVANTTQKLNQLRSAQQQVEEQFQRGEIGAEQYRAFRRELLQTEQQLQHYQQQIVEMNAEQDRVAQGTRQLTTLFDATGTSVQDYANVIGNRLVTAIQNGTATSRDLEYAFQRIGRQTIGTNGDIERLRQTLASVDNGNSIQNIRTDIQLLSQEVEEAEGSVKELGGELTNLAAGLAAGGGLAEIVEKALDSSSLNTKIDIVFDVPEESMGAVRSAVKGIEAYGVDGEAALEGVRRQWALNKDASDAANDTIVRGAAAITTAFAGVDFTELIQETNEIGAALKISNADALALVDSLLKAGFPPEQLDTIAEYGTQMKNAGFSAKEVQAIFEAGIDTKTWNIDNLNDGVKEARITMSEFGLEVDENMGKLLEKAGKSSKEFKTWGKAVADGGTEGSKAMSEMVTWLDGIEDKALKNELAIKVFGTKWEDQGQNMISVFKGVGEAVDKTTENTNGLYETMGKVNGDPAVQLQQALTNMNTALQPVLTNIAELVANIANWVAENPKLAATITGIVTGLGIFMGIIMGLAPVVTSVVSLMGTFGLTLGAITAPVAAVVAGIAALIAIGVLLYQNWETVKQFALTVWSEIGQHFGGVIEQIKGYVQTGMEFVQSTIQSILTAAVTFAQGLLSSFSAFWKENGDQIVSIVRGAMELVSSIISGALKVIEGLFQAVWPIVSGVVKVAWGIISTATQSTIDFILGIIQFFLKIFQGDWSGAFETIMETTEKIWNNIVSTFEGIDLLQIGKDIINGLINGITSMAKGVWDAVTAIGNTIKDVFTNMFNINSPSRWMRDMIGKNMMEGWIDGIKSMESKVLSVSSEMGQLMKPKIPSDYGFPQNVDNSRTFQPNIKIYTSDSGERAMNRTLRRLAFEFN